MPTITSHAHQEPVDAGGMEIRVSTTNLGGLITGYAGAGRETRSVGDAQVADDLTTEEIEEVASLVIEDDRPAADLDKELTLAIPDDGTYLEGLLIYVDENGRVSLHPPEAPTPGKRSLAFNFTVPVRPAVPEETAAGKRGLAGVIGKKVFKFVAWKAAKKAAESYGPPMIRAWERWKRPRRIVSGASLFEDGGEEMMGGIPAGEPGLLFIHGTFSRVAAAFHGIDEGKFIDQVRTKYADRIYGYDHPTMASGIATNVMQFYDHLAPGHHVFDVICHSRGGVLARALRDLQDPQVLQAQFGLDAVRGRYDEEFLEWGATWQKRPDVTVEIRRIIFGGAPNNGTILASGRFLKQWIETLLTASNVLPEGVDVAVDALLTAAKLLVEGVAPQLPGLDDQVPESELLRRLSAVPRPGDAAIQADFAPDKVLAGMFDIAWERVFEDRPNDLLVSLDSVSRWPAGGFPTERTLTFDQNQVAEGRAPVWHSSLFRQAETAEQIVAWLDR